MLSIHDKNLVDKYLTDSKISKQISYELQKDELRNKYPNSILEEEGETLFEYIYKLLHKLPFGIIKSRYLEEILIYLHKESNPYLVSCRKEIYPIIGKKHTKDAKSIEGSIRHFINKEFMNIHNHIKQEYFSVPEGMIPTNFYFLMNLEEYIKTHYFGDNQIALTKEQEEYFLNNLPKENNVLYIFEQNQKRKLIEKFLYEQLGFFRYQASNSSFIFVDIILYCMENDVCSLQEFYSNLDFIEKWQIWDYESFVSKCCSLSFTIETAYKNANMEVYKQIFGDTSLHRALLNYILKVVQYLKEQEYTRSLKQI